MKLKTQNNMSFIENKGQWDNSVEFKTSIKPKLVNVDADKYLLAEINVFAKQVAKKIEAAIPCARIGVAVIGLEVPHAHIHLIPLNTVQDINFSRPKLTISAERMQEIATKIND